MKRIVLLAVIALIVIVGKGWKERDTLDAYLNSNGFANIGSIPEGAEKGVVLIMTMPNCPSETAQRADRLFAALSQEKIPVIRSQRIAFEFIEPSSEQKAGLKRFNQLIKRDSPTIILGSHAAANPHTEQVIRQYRSMYTH